MVDGIRLNLTLEIMTNDFYTREQDAATIFILYLYMLCMKEIANRPFTKTVDEMMQEKLVLIPVEYQGEFC